MAIAVNLKRRAAANQSLADFDKRWSDLLAEIDRLVRRRQELQDTIVAVMLGTETELSRSDIDAELAAIAVELEPLLAARANEGELRQRVVTEIAERRFDEIADLRRKLEVDVRKALTELRDKAEEFAQADAKLRALGDQDFELANEQAGCSDRGHLGRHVEPTFRGVGLGGVDFMVQRIEEDLIAIARRAQ